MQNLKKNQNRSSEKLFTDINKDKHTNIIQKYIHFFLICDIYLVFKNTKRQNRFVNIKSHRNL